MKRLLAPLAIRRTSPYQPAAVSLITELDAYQAALYPAESNHLLSLEALSQANVHFLLAELAGVAVGCGAVVMHKDYAEIKRMFVPPAQRGQGIARALLSALEEAASREGKPLLRLETGIHQPEAIGLYAVAGFESCPPFGDYLADPLSKFMEKALT